MKIMSIAAHFTVDTAAQITRDDLVTISQPDDFMCLGAFGENAAEFNDYCAANRTIDDANLTPDQMDAIATLLNRAVAYGQKIAAN